VNSRAYEVGPIESGVPLPERFSQTHTLDQQRVLELDDGDSFLLQVKPLVDGEARLRCHSVPYLAARLSAWARGRKVRLAYRMIDKSTARIWRLGTM
jgi:hypothetical protein